MAASLSTVPTHGFGADKKLEPGSRQKASRVSRPEPPKILIVGNGPSAASRDWGEYIDSFDEVIRFNYYRLNDWQEKVGSRTTIWSKAENFPDSPLPRGVSLMRISPVGGGMKFRSTGVCCVERSVSGLRWPSSGVCIANHFIKQGITPVIIGLDAYGEGPRNYWSDEPCQEDDPHSSEEESNWLFEMASAGLIHLLEETQGA